MTDFDTTPSSVRPAVVTAAFWVWTVSAVLVVLLALLSLTVPSDDIRERLVDAGRTAGDADAVLRVLRGYGVVAVIVAAVVAFLTGPTCRRGDRRYRRALVTLSVMSGLILPGSTLVGFALVPMLAVFGGLGFLVASTLVYRPSASRWFAVGADR